MARSSGRAMVVGSSGHGTGISHSKPGCSGPNSGLDSFGMFHTSEFQCRVLNQDSCWQSDLAIWKILNSITNGTFYTVHLVSRTWSQHPAGFIDPSRSARDGPVKKKRNPYFCLSTESSQLIILNVLDRVIPSFRARKSRKWLFWVLWSCGLICSCSQSSFQVLWALDVLIHTCNVKSQWDLDFIIDCNISPTAMSMQLILSELGSKWPLPSQLTKVTGTDVYPQPWRCFKLRKGQIL